MTKKSKGFPFSLSGDNADAIKLINQRKQTSPRGFGKDNAPGGANNTPISQEPHNMNNENQPSQQGHVQSDNAVIPEQPTKQPEQQAQQQQQVEFESYGNDTIPLTQTQLQQIIANQVRKQAEKDAALIKAKLAEVQQAKEEAERLADEVEQIKLAKDAAVRHEQEKNKKLFNVFSDIGVDIAPDGSILDDGYNRFAPSQDSVLAGTNSNNSSQRVYTGSSRIYHTSRDAHRELQRIFSSETPKRTLAHPTTGALVDVYDTAQLDSFVRKNFALCVDALDFGFKKLGFLQGRNIDAPTTQNNIPPMYLEALSTLVRETHMSQFVMRQFAVNVPAMGYNVGDTVQIPRSDFSATSADLADWQLDVATALDSASQPIMMGHVKAQLREYGMGKAGTNMLPIAVPAFIMATSMQQLLGIVQTNLGRNYREFEELYLRSLWEGTTIVRYNRNNAVSDTIPNANTQRGALTREFLVALAAYMHGDLKIPTFDDGKYVLVTNPLSLATLIHSIDVNSRYIEKESIEDLTSLMNFATGNDLGRVSGYQFTVGNFHVFSQNSYGVGQATSPGVINSDVSSTTTTFRSSFAVGRNTIGRAIAKPFTIVRSNNDDFQRMNRYTWVSYEAFAQLDVDPGQQNQDPATANQQARVIEVMTTDSII